MKRPSDWLKELDLLTCRFAHLGFSADLAGMTVCELIGLHAYLSRLAANGL
jgi:hypothetical protein